jgi:DNA (cytosine-5)-methyltransferase 1
MGGRIAGQGRNVGRTEVSEMSVAYYNENDPFAAAWLKELIKAGHIAFGYVDDRSIEDVTPNDLKGFAQCHFFAGIGVWSYALRRAGWPDDKEVWTGSCPCQPFSTAGKRRGFDDERHLWPSWYWLIEQCAPRVVFGEQVASKDGITWLDAVCTDLEGTGYAVGPVVLPACGVGAPHRRERLWFVADSYQDASRRDARRILEPKSSFVWSTQPKNNGPGPSRNCVRTLADGASLGRERRRPSETVLSKGSKSEPKRFCDARRALGDGISAGLQGRGGRPETKQSERTVGRPSPVNGYWQNAEWVWCRDDKYRAIEPGTFPLVNGAPARMGRLRGYGNAIVAAAAKEVISAYMDLNRS